MTVVDPAPGSGASPAAAGMLAPVTELHYGELALLRLGLESARRYPDFVAALREATGIDVGYRRTGTLVAAWDGADLTALRDLHALQTSLGLEAEMLTGRELRSLEPALAAGLPGGLLARDDHQVDNRLLHEALLAAIRADGADGADGPGRSLVAENVPALIGEQRVTGVQLADGRTLSAGVTVLAAGAWSGFVDDVPVRPVKGQTLRLQVPGEQLLTHVVRGSVKGSPVYAVPRDNGEIVIGASSEETGFDLHPRAGAIYELLRDAQSLIPALGEAHFREVSTSLRPAAPDNAPIIGPSNRVDGLIIATAHYRNGILLTPITADAVAELIGSGVTPAEITAFGPGRFAAVSR